MTDATVLHVLWALALGGVSAVSLPLGSLVGLRWQFSRTTISILAAFGAGALIAALSVELVAPTALALTESGHGGDDGHALANFLALMIGGVLGGLLFVALDSVVNSSGGHIRKTATTLAEVARQRRQDIRAMMAAVSRARPFDALPGNLAEDLAAMLRPVDFKRGVVLSGREADSDEAYVVVEGEVDAEVDGAHAAVFGPGTLVGAVTLVAPELEGLGRVTARTDVSCLALRRGDVDRLRALSPDFDRACRKLAGDRMEGLKEQLATRLSQTVEWARTAAASLRHGGQVPEIALRKAGSESHGSPLAVWLGIFLDGIPESVVIGAGLFVTVAAHPAAETLRLFHVIPYTLIAGLFLSNFPEALSSSANMLAAGLTRRRIFLMWLALMVITAVGAGAGFLLAGVLDETWLVFAEGVAAGAMLTMIAAAMIPEAAHHGSPSQVGLGTLAGFLAAVMFKLVE
jgi:zinc transporter ZupT